MYSKYTNIRDWSLINDGGGVTKWENRGPKTFSVAPLHRGKTSLVPSRLSNRVIL